MNSLASLVAVLEKGGDLEDLLQGFAHELRLSLDCEFLGLGLKEPDGTVVLRAVSSTTPVTLTLGHRQGAGEGVTGEATRLGRPVLVPDVRSHQNYVSTGPAVVSELCCPIVLGATTLGFVDAASSSRALGPADVEKGTALAEWLAVPLSVAIAAREREARRDEFVAMLVHDLRNPTTVLALNLELVGRSTTLGAAGQHALQEARASCDELHFLIDGILSVQKAESGRLALQLSAVRAGEFLPAAVGHLQVLAVSRRIELVCEVGPDAPTVHVDVGLLTRVLENLLSSAIKHSPRDARVSVTAERADAAVMRDHLRAAREALLISVVDAGPGVPDAEKERIFEKYAVLRGPRTGRYSTGLGLAFARRAALAHGGALWVENAPGGGSTFRLLLPAQE